MLGSVAWHLVLGVPSSHHRQVALGTAATPYDVICMTRSFHFYLERPVPVWVQAGVIGPQCEDACFYSISDSSTCRTPSAMKLESKACTIEVYSSIYTGHSAFSIWLFVL